MTNFLGEFAAGLGISISNSIEGVLELGNFIPGVDYDLKLTEGLLDAFDYEESDSFAEQFGEFVGFAGSLATGAGAVGKAAGVAGKAATKVKYLRGYEQGRAARAAHALTKKHPLASKLMKEEAKFAMADFLMTAGDDAFDLVTLLGLEDAAIVEHFALQEGESELTRRLKGAMQGAVIGLPLSFGMEGAGKAFSKLRKSDDVLDQVDEVVPKPEVDEAAPKAQEEPDVLQASFPEQESKLGQVKSDTSPEPYEDQTMAARELLVALNGEDIVDYKQGLMSNSPLVQDGKYIGDEVIKTTKENLEKELDVVNRAINAGEEGARAKKVELEKQIGQLEVAQKKSDELVPGLFKGEEPKEHLEKVDNVIENFGQRTDKKPRGISEKEKLRIAKKNVAIANKLGKFKESIDEVVEGGFDVSEERLKAIFDDDVVKEMSPDDLLTVAELVAVKGQTLEKLDFDFDDSIKESLEKFSQAKVFGEDEHLANAAYNTYGIVLQKLEANVARKLRASNRKESFQKKVGGKSGQNPLELDRLPKGKDNDVRALQTTQALDTLMTVLDSMRGVHRPQDYAKRRSYSSISPVAVEEMSEGALKAELKRNQGRLRYDFQALKKAVTELDNNEISTLDFINLAHKKGAGLWSAKAAELVTASLLASPKLMLGNILQTGINVATKKGTKSIGKVILGFNPKSKEAFKQVAEVAAQNQKAIITKSEGGLKMWKRFLLASKKGQEKVGAGSLFATADSSREVLNRVSPFEQHSNLRALGTMVNSAADDAFKAQVMFNSITDRLLNSKVLDPRAKEKIINILPDVLESSLASGKQIKIDDIEATLTQIAQPELDAAIRAQKDTQKFIDQANGLATEKPSVDTMDALLDARQAAENSQMDQENTMRLFHEAGEEDNPAAVFQQELLGVLKQSYADAQDATFTSMKSVDEIRQQHDISIMGKTLPIHSSIAMLTRKTAGLLEETNPLLRAVSMPFVNTPMNVVLYSSSFTPLSQSFWRGLDATFRPGKYLSLDNLMDNIAANGVTDEIIEDIGKAWAGVTIGATTMALLSTGTIEITGAGPSDPKKKKTWMEQGNRPYSLRIGDKTLSLNRIGAAALPVMMAADLHENMLASPYGEEGMTANIQDFMAASMDIGMNANMLESAESVLAALTGDQAALSRLASNAALGGAGALLPTWAANYVPFISGATTTASQFSAPIERTGEGFGGKVYDNLLNRYARFAGDKRRNVYGEDISPNTADVLLNQLGLFEMSSPQFSKVNKEMEKLNFPIAKMGFKMEGVNMLEDRFEMGDQSAYDRYQEIYGTVRVGGKTLTQSLDRLISSSKYGRLSDQGIPEEGIPSPREVEIRSVVSKYRNKAKEQLMRENPALKEAIRNVKGAKNALATGRSQAEVMANLFPDL